MLDNLYYWASAFWPLWLTVLFIGIVAWAYWPSRKGEMEAHGRIPFEDDRQG
jgi:cytochrome c oxidase cbb3-type subunit 4